MARDANVRNLRDGQIVIKDADSPVNSLTVVLDEGNLKWTEKNNVITHRDRGTLHSHRSGDDEPVELTFSAKWTQLIGFTVTSTNGIELYEMINNLQGDFVSVAGCGENFALTYEFTVSSPCGTATAGEKITFAEVIKQTLTCSEGNEMNTIEFSGIDFETKPVIARV